MDDGGGSKRAVARQRAGPRTVRSTNVTMTVTLARKRGKSPRFRANVTAIVRVMTMNGRPARPCSGPPAGRADEFKNSQ
jgi:hypothetical protein